MSIKTGIFTVSLDFELYWGLRDTTTINEYEANLKGAKIAYETIITNFASGNLKNIKYLLGKKVFDRNCGSQ